MSVFLDTGFFIAIHNKDDGYHERAMKFAEPIKNKELGELFTSEYVINEAITLSLSKFGHKRAVELGEAILNSEVAILEVSKNVFDNAWALFKQRNNLSFTDCTTAKLMNQKGIKNIATFDSGFRQFREINVLG